MFEDDQNWFFPYYLNDVWQLQLQGDFSFNLIFTTSNFPLLTKIEDWCKLVQLKITNTEVIDNSKPKCECFQMDCFKVFA